MNPTWFTAKSCGRKTMRVRQALRSVHGAVYRASLWYGGESLLRYQLSPATLAALSLLLTKSTRTLAEDLGRVGSEVNYRRRFSVRQRSGVKPQVGQFTVTQLEWVEEGCFNIGFVVRRRSTGLVRTRGGVGRPKSGGNHARGN